MTRVLAIILLVVVGLIGFMACGPAEETAQMASDMEGQLKDALGFDPALLPELAETRTLASISDEERKNIYLDYHTGNMRAMKASFAMDIDNSELLASVQEQLLDKNKYDMASNYGITTAQIDKLNIIGNKYDWPKSH